MVANGAQLAWHVGMRKGWMRQTIRGTAALQGRVAVLRGGLDVAVVVLLVRWAAAGGKKQNQSLYSRGVIDDEWAARWLVCPRERPASEGLAQAYAWGLPATKEASEHPIPRSALTPFGHPRLLGGHDQNGRYRQEDSPSA